jgi:hypothetical protein
MDGRHARAVRRFLQHHRILAAQPAQARAVVNGEQSLLVLAGQGAVKRRCWWRVQAGF